MFILLEYNFYSQPPENISRLKNSSDNNERNLDDILATKYVKGDIDQDGQIDKDDIKLFLGYITHQEEPQDAEKLKAADFNGDGKVSELDFGEFEKIINAKQADGSIYLKVESFIGTGGILPDNVNEGISDNLDNLISGISFDSTDGPPHPNQDITKGGPQGPPGGNVGNRPEGPPGGNAGNRPQGPPGGNAGNRPEGPPGGNVGNRPQGPLESNKNDDEVTKKLIDSLLQILSNTDAGKIDWANVMVLLQQIINGSGGGGNDGGGDIDVDDDEPVDDGPYFKGDVDNDGDIDNEDLKLAKQIGMDPEMDSSDPAYDAADINDDGDVNGDDIALFKKRIKGPKNMDFTYDKKFDSEDISAIEDYINGDSLFTEAEQKSADLNKDGEVDTKDIDILKNRSEERPVGDINNDGKMDEIDLNLMKDANKGKYELTKEEQKAADLDGQGGFTKKDIEYFEKILQPLQKGDVNGDGKIDEVDLNLVKNNGEDNLLTKAQQDAIDFNDDGKFDQQDIDSFDLKFKARGVGDLDGNNIVDSKDLASLIEAIKNAGNLTAAEKTAMDINKDGEVDNKDVDAMNEKFKPKVKGNIDGNTYIDKNDGTTKQIIDAIDINIFQSYLSGNMGFTLEELKACDIDGTLVDYMLNGIKDDSPEDAEKKKSNYLFQFAQYVEKLQDGLISPMPAQKPSKNKKK